MPDAYILGVNTTTRPHWRLTMPDAYILGVNTPNKFIRVLTADKQTMNVHVQPSDLAALKWLIEVMEAEDDC